MTNAHAESLGPDLRRGDRNYEGFRRSDKLSGNHFLIMTGSAKKMPATSAGMMKRGVMTQA